MGNSLYRDLAANLVTANGLGATALTAGGAGDNTAANGISIDLLNYSMVESVTYVVTATAVLGAGQKLTTAAKIQDSADNSSWADVSVPVSYSGIPTATTVTTAVGAGTYQQVGVIGVPTEYCRRYVRCVITPDLDRAGTDTATVMAAALLWGSHRLSAI